MLRTTAGVMRFMAPPGLPDHRDLAADDMQGFTLALGFDHDDVAPTRDEIALSVLSIPYERVESGLAPRGPALELFAQDEISALREDPQRDHRVIVDLVRDRGRLRRRMEWIRVAVGRASRRVRVHERALEIQVAAEPVRGRVDPVRLGSL